MTSAEQDLAEQDLMEYLDARRSREQEPEGAQTLGPVAQPLMLFVAVLVSGLTFSCLVPDEGPVPSAAPEPQAKVMAERVAPLPNMTPTGGPHGS